MEARTSPAPLIELATAYWGSATLIAAIRLRLFSEIAAGSHSVNAISDALGAKLEATEALLCACASLQLLTRDGDSFDNTEIASTYLVEGKPGYLGPALLYNGDVFPLWGELNQVILRGDADQAPDQYLGDDASRTKNFVLIKLVANAGKVNVNYFAKLALGKSGNSDSSGFVFNFYPSVLVGKI